MKTGIYCVYSDFFPEYVDMGYINIVKTWLWKE